MKGPEVLLVLLLTAGCLSHTIEKRDVFFQDVVRQRSLGNAGITQCPCVMHPESRQCISYDSRYQASTIEEAILTFQDLTKDSFFATPVNAGTFSCQTVECQQCFGLLYYRLLDVGLIRGGFRPYTIVLPRNQLNPAYCPRFNFPVPTVVPPPPQVPDYVRKLIAEGQRYMASGALFAPPRQFQNPNRFRPGPIPAAPPSSVRNQPQRWQQSRSQQPQQQWQQPRSQQPAQQWQQPRVQPQQPQWQSRPQWQPTVPRTSPVQQIASQLVWNALARRWEQRQNNPPQVTPRPHNPLLQQGRSWQQSQSQQWNQAQANQQSQWNQAQLQANQQAQWNQAQIRANQQAQLQATQQAQWNAQLQANQQAQLQSNQQAQWNQAQPQASQQAQFPQPQWNQQNPWSQQITQPAVQQSVLQQALGHTQQAFNPLTQQLPNLFGNGQQGQGQGGGGGGHGGIGATVMGGLFGRKKRAADPVVGRRFNIACVKRGETSSEYGEFLSLCGTCWTWRELPDDYFPRILNELSCQEGDYCLSGDTVVFVELIDPSGWGQCQQQYRNVDVLRKVDGRWVPTTVTTATCCDCRVKAGTVMHALVLGDKQRTE